MARQWEYPIYARIYVILEWHLFPIDNNGFYFIRRFF